MIVVPGPLSDGESEMEYLIVAWKVLNYFPPKSNNVGKYATNQGYEWVLTGAHGV